MKSQVIWNITTGSADFASLQSMQVDLLDNRFYETLSADIWKPIKVYLRRADKPTSDIMRLTLNVFAFNKRAQDTLLDVINGSVEFLPLNYEPETLQVVNVTDILDCVDLSNSNFEKPYLGIEVQAHGLIFEKGCLEDKHMFKLPLLSNQVFVSDKFKQVVEENNLTGAEFIPVSAFEK